MEIVNLDVEDPARNPPILPESQWRPTIVTAFSSNKAEVGLLMLRSLGKVAAEQTEFNVSVVVYTLNRFPAIARRVLLCVINELQTVYKVPAEIRQFDFDAWPSWMHLNQTLSPNAGSGNNPKYLDDLIFRIIIHYLSFINRSQLIDLIIVLMQENTRGKP